MKLIFSFIVFGAILFMGCSQPLETITTLEEANEFDDTVTDSEPKTIHENDFEPIIEPQEENEIIEPEEEIQIETPKIDDCLNKKFTVSHIELDKIEDITPLGNLNPPDHTLPTEHLYFGHKESFGKTEVISPGEIRIYTLEFGEQGDYGIRFEVCSEIRGYFGHIHDLSPFLKEEFDKAECYQYTTGMRPREFCEREVDITLKAGDLIGHIGINDMGTSDFGLVNYLSKLDYVNKERYGKDSLGKVCALDFFEDSIKEKLYEKLFGNLENACGSPMQDISGTLQGNWYYIDAPNNPLSEWNQHLSFVPSNINPINEVLSIGGIFSDPYAMHFKPMNSGTTNRAFKDITNDGKIYCYSGGDKFGNSINGKVIVQMTSDIALQIEKQSGSCLGNYSFSKQFEYER